MVCSGRLAVSDILLKNGRTCHEHCSQAGKYGQRRGTCGQGVASYGIYERNRIGHSPGLSRSRLGIFLNGFGKPEDVADAQAKIASDFKVRVSFSAADMSKPAAIREMIEKTLQTSGRRAPPAQRHRHIGMENAIHEQTHVAPTCRYDRSFPR